MGYKEEGGTVLRMMKLSQMQGSYRSGCSSNLLRLISAEVLNQKMAVVRK